MTWLAEFEHAGLATRSARYHTSYSESHWPPPRASATWCNLSNEHYVSGCNLRIARPIHDDDVAVALSRDPDRAFLCRIFSFRDYTLWDFVPKGLV
jgi:hypothetical protein